MVFKKSGITALSGISLQIHHGEVLGIGGGERQWQVNTGHGDSGLCTLQHWLHPVQSRESSQRPAKSAHARARRQIQMVFQDPYSSLNNCRAVEANLTEPLRFMGWPAQEQNLENSLPPY